jgi:hypothetical protein
VNIKLNGDDYIMSGDEDQENRLVLSLGKRLGARPITQPQPLPDGAIGSATDLSDIVGEPDPEASSDFYDAGSKPAELELTRRRKVALAEDNVHDFDAAVTHLKPNYDVVEVLPQEVAGRGRAGADYLHSLGLDEGDIIGMDINFKYAGANKDGLQSLIDVARTKQREHRSGNTGFLPVRRAVLYSSMVNTLYEGDGAVSPRVALIPPASEGGFDVYISLKSTIVGTDGEQETVDYAPALENAVNNVFSGRSKPVNLRE